MRDHVAGEVNGAITEHAAHPAARGPRTWDGTRAVHTSTRTAHPAEPRAEHAGRAHEHADRASGRARGPRIRPSTRAEHTAEHALQHDAAQRTCTAIVILSRAARPRRDVRSVERRRGLADKP
jgi:hypothetical protein